MGRVSASTSHDGLPLWEATLLRRSGESRKPSVAGRAEFHAADLGSARAEAEAELVRRSGGADGWSLGLLRPLTPSAPGTYLYEIIFALWESEGDHMERRDVAHLHAWAQDAATARRIAQHDIQDVDGYIPAWRIRRVGRVPEPDTGPL